MSLESWLNNGWLRAHKTSPQEIKDLLEIVERDLKDAGGDISADWRFGIAYNAALKLCTILVFASGFRPEKTLQHSRTIQALSLVLGPARQPDVDYLDTCRSRRNTIEYDHAGGVTTNNADELIDFVNEQRVDVVEWLRQNHPELLPSQNRGLGK
jgi:hypothetical protein